MADRGRLERGLHLHIDGASGAAGDMFLGALIDLGVPAEVVGDALDRVGLGRERLVVARVVKRGVAAVDVKIDDTPVAGHRHHHHEHDHEHDHDHDHHEHDRDHDRHHHDPHGEHDHAHTRYADIVDLLERSTLDAETRRRALDMFERIAVAEAHLHGTTPAEVSFHEVGAIDSIADVVGAAAGLAYLAPAAVTAVSVAMGHGRIRSAHGILPVPSPAALEILRAAGGVTVDGGVARELCTPTGAAILAHAVTSWAPMPPVRPVAVGHGAGDAELADRPNVLRLIAGQPLEGAGADADETLYRIEANLDDMSPEMCEHAADAMVAAGAVDVWWTAITMKKTRPALLLAALAPPEALDRVVRAVLTETTTIGVRFERVARRVLAREHVEVDTPFGRLPVKLARLDGRVVNAAPEYEACRAAARAHSVPLKQVFAAALAAWSSRDR